MKTSNFGFVAVLGIVLNVGVFAQGIAPPANDNLSAARPLAGARVDFDGSVYGATAEPGENLSEIWFNGSAWWSWTAPVTGYAAIVVNGSPKFQDFLWDALAVYRGSTWTAFEQTGAHLATLDVRPGFDIGFNIVAGETYSFALMGDASTNLTFQFTLMASNSPIVLSQPSGVVAHPGDSVYFTVRTPNRRDGGFQWQVNGQDLPVEYVQIFVGDPPVAIGETGPTLALNNISSTNAGDYRVIVLGAPGQPNATSQVARLEIQGDPVPTRTHLVKTGETNRFTLELTGDDRFLRQVERSSGFLGWEAVFVSGLGYRIPGLSIPLPATPTNEMFFYRTRQIGDGKQWCIANLQRLKFAKQRALVDHRRVSGQAVNGFEVDDYFGYKIPRCPAGGTYTYNSYGVDPTCSIAGHTL